jgi:hypothetical protein
MTRKLFGAALGALILAVAAPLFTLALLHGVSGTAQAQVPPNYTKVSVPDFGQHSQSWCWVGAAANSFWWYAHNTVGQDGLLGGALHPWEATDPLSQNPPVGNPWYDSNDLPQGYLGPLPIPGYRKLLSMIAGTTFNDLSQDGLQQPPGETNYVYGQGVEEWDYLVGLGTYVNSYGSGLVVHDIIDPARCLPGNYGMKPDDRLNPPAFNALNPCGLDGVPDAELRFDQAPGPPTFLDYQTELSGGQDVLLWMESTYPETAHVVTGVGYNTSPAPGTITISDPWTHSTCPDHDDCWPLKARPDGQMPDHNNASGHAVGPYNVCTVVNPGPAPKFTINCGGTIWTVVDLIFVSPATADVKIVSQQILDANCADPPPTDIDVSVDTPICVRKVLHNNGPYGPVSVNIDKTATAPLGCTILPANATDQVVLPVSEATVHDELFTIHCDQASTHGPFTIDNTISIKDPGVTDPVPANNVASSTLTVDALGYADIKITSQSFLNPPAQMTVGVPEVVTLRKVLHNNGLYGPVAVDIAKTAHTDSPNATIAPPTAGDQVDLDVGSTVTHDEVFTLRCSAPGNYTYTVDNNVTPKDPHIVDLNGASASTHLTLECVAGAQEVKWDQLPDESPMGLDVGSLVPGLPFVLADDFQCTESGMITEIDFWASWYHDQPPMGDPNMVQFTLSLHSDVPAGPSYSHPNQVLWMHTFGPGECVAQLWGMGEEGWLQPPVNYDPFADTQIWLYSCPIPTAYWFQQAVGTVYWLDVQAMPMDPAFLFGWKTSLEHWNDDGVWSMGMEPIDPSSWQPLVYPPGHPMAGMSIDLAFQIQGQPCDPLLDSDADTFKDAIECYLPTDSRDNCRDGPGDDAWPLDINMDTYVTVVGDVLKYSGRIGSTGGPPPSAMWLKRLDLSKDNFLTVVGDVLKFSGKIGAHCT